MQYICKECNLEFKSLWGLSSHNVQKHKLKPEDLYIEYELNGQKPTCACGCGETPNFLGIKKGFVKYVKGHHQRVQNNWGHNPEIVKKSHDIQKKLFQEGKLKSWNKGLTKEVDDRLGYGQKISDNKERSEKISKALKGRKRPKKVLEKLNKGMLEYWSKPENREQRRLDQVEYLRTKQINKKSKLEQKFEDLLTELNIQFINQHPLNGYLYDFYIPKHNILIEVDGDWFHCNPDVHPEAIHEIQKFVKENDERKNIIAKENNIPLLRFWEKDINDSIDSVKSKLSEYL
jgi:very-short-patch-repair endonuclease